MYCITIISIYNLSPFLYVVSLEGRTPLLAPLTLAKVSEEKIKEYKTSYLSGWQGAAYLEMSPRAAPGG